MEEPSHATTQSTTHNCKHQWTVNEDALLVMCLLELKIEGIFLAENGFKPGYLNALEAVMEQNAPGCGIKGKPHIQSRLKTMKTNWQTVYDMVYGQNTSGFGWDNENKCIIAEKEVWEAYIKETIYSELMKVEGLSQDEKIAASVKISINPALLHVFPTIPTDDKAKWVRHVLNSLLI
ncbi:hypothetical protein NMG60_11007208 [Bertholletia excelsa]